ncbi:MAG TPA: SAM-dependent methyltransferase [Candidatus Pacebacteria bacterium]|nr:MAG: hypothetical protein A2378_01945 [Candidatus Pacebacteria bacterium RIFOXYB1_FULL_44_10]HAU99379.1 SAM-dependent methyltransferase [Candidatus Paceibacterota bacterium]HAX01616.1 SAM-dependent methyltransferase [Candidatus Paceibacterota bacterium]
MFGRPPARLAQQSTGSTQPSRFAQQSTSKQKTSWEKVSEWYNELVGSNGQYYHQHVILPNLLRLLNLSHFDSVLDIGCGQGVLARAIPPVSRYLGLDISPSLISQARKQTRQRGAQFAVADVTAPFSHVKEITKQPFTHAVAVLSMQNLEHPDQCIQSVAQVLENDGVFALVINHPCFRIPRQSSWQIDEQNKTQYRRINRYLSPIAIPISMKPSASRNSKHEKLTWSYHFPLSYFVSQLANAGFVIEHLEEWGSDKQSAGANAKMENRSRDEFPLFMAIVARKIRIKNPTR